MHGRKHSVTFFLIERILFWNNKYNIYDKIQSNIVSYPFISLCLVDNSTFCSRKGNKPISEGNERRFCFPNVHQNAIAQHFVIKYSQITNFMIRNWIFRDFLSLEHMSLNYQKYGCP